MNHFDQQREAGRNHLLRRADWRFLLPNPDPKRSICFADGLLASATSAISERVLPLHPTPQATCDLAVDLNPTPSMLRMAWLALQPGGASYSEWYSPFVRGAQGIRRRLTAAGFSDVVCYWFWPPPRYGLVKFWLPLEAPHVLHYFLSTRPPTDSLITKIVRRAWLGALHTSLVIPICAIARKAQTETTQNSMPIFRESQHSVVELRSEATPSQPAPLETLRARWAQETWNLGRTPEQLIWLLLTGGQRSENKVVGLVFDEFTSKPQMVVKLSRNPEAARVLAQEKKVLQALQVLRPEGIAGTPRLLYYEEKSAYTLLGQTALLGRPIFDCLRRDTFHALASQATDWLIVLAGRPTPQPRASWWSRLIEPLLTNFEQSYSSVVKPELLQVQRILMNTLDDLPLVCEHRDFELWNVQRAPDGKLLVLDWESAELQGLPALDLILFLAYLSLCLERALDSPQQRRAAYRAALNPNTFTGRVVAQCLNRYAEQVGVPTQALPALRVLTWLIHAGWAYADFTKDAATQPSPGILRHSLFLTLWEEEIQAAATNYTELSLIP